MRTVLITLATLLVSGVAGGWMVIRLGWYDISATAPHTQAVYSLLETTMHHSVRLRASEIAVPKLDDAARVERGGACFVAHCVECHGGPGVAQGPIGRSMQPLPGPLVAAGDSWRPAELYWITRNGIKMSGMPAWRFRMNDDDLWAVVAFMQRLPLLTAPTFREIAARHADADCAVGDGVPPDADADGRGAAMPAPDPERGRLALSQFACSACHRIPDVTGSDVHVGPPLAGYARRQLIAGRLPNTPAMLVRWIRDPRAIDPLTTMPAMGVPERDARDIAAYLLTLH